MALKVDSELLHDARKEHKEYVSKNGDETELKKYVAGSGDAKKPDPATASQDPGKTEEQPGDSTSQSTQEGPDEFEQMFKEYFKDNGMGFAGTMVTEFVDDLKANLLYIYAKKCGVDIDKSALCMTEKQKKFCGFLVDYAVKNNMIGWLKKNPLIGAAGVVLLSAGSSYMFIQMMKSQKEDISKKDAELEKLRKEKEQWQRSNAQTVDYTEVKV